MKILLTNMIINVENIFARVAVPEADRPGLTS